mmetsp:Transcript_41479/g.106944  ORF Transcript_41479/g.106944 Transcript_41479/m.106944 type:complete len:260 (-) Transcript_41479:64-843(-)
MRLWLSGFRAPGRSCDMSKPKTISEIQQTFLPSLVTHTSCTTRLPGSISMMFTNATQTSSASAGMASAMPPRATQQCRTMFSSALKNCTTLTTSLNKSRKRHSLLKMSPGFCLRSSTHCLTTACSLISGSRSNSLSVTLKKQSSTSIGRLSNSFSISLTTSCSEESASSASSCRWGSASCSGSESEGTGVGARPPSAARFAAGSGSGAGSSSDAPTSTSTSSAPAPAATGASAAPTARCLWRRLARLRGEAHCTVGVKR